MCTCVYAACVAMKSSFQNTGNITVYARLCSVCKILKTAFKKQQTSHICTSVHIWVVHKCKTTFQQ